MATQLTTTAICHTWTAHPAFLQDRFPAPFSSNVLRRKLMGERGYPRCAELFAEEAATCPHPLPKIRMTASLPLTMISGPAIYPIFRSTHIGSQRTFETSPPSACPKHESKEWPPQETQMVFADLFLGRRTTPKRHPHKNTHVCGGAGSKRVRGVHARRALLVPAAALLQSCK